LKLLLDNCVHKAVKGFFPGHQATTAFQAGLARLENGELLAAAAKLFDVLVTTDKNIRSQQNLDTLPIPVIELAAADTRIEGLLPLAPFCPTALEHTSRYWFVSVRSDGSLELNGDRTQNPPAANR
jgi:hypothetical protein